MANIMANAFYFIKKAILICSWDFKFLQFFFNFFHTSQVQKDVNESGIIYDVMNWLA